MNSDPLTHPVMDRVRRSLGRAVSPLPSPPVPPVIDEPIARLVHSSIGLPELFIKRASDMKMLVEAVTADDLLERLTTFIREQGMKRVMLSDTPVILRMNICRHLNEQGIEAKQWADMTADETYDFDCGVTEVDYGVAETGTVVIRHSPQHGRLLSLVPFVHVAIVEPSKLVPDLIDLMDALKRDGTGSGTTLISGPSKTADIEMNTVTGVHGPNVVKAFVLS
jgi:L-lactate dehydrogenase complex protein LldG